jgi:hypothetical protein
MKVHETHFPGLSLPVSRRSPPMRATLLSLPTDTLHIRPWPDPVIDAVGLDPRSPYVERFWLGVLGPSTTWLLRRIAGELEASPAGFDLPLEETARSLGLGVPGKHGPFVNALTRCCQFQLAQVQDEGVLAFRRKMPPLNRRQLVRLPESVQAEHDAWNSREAEEPMIEQLRRRSRRLALSLLELGEDPEATERQLLRWRFHPALCCESTRWAQDQLRQADAEPALSAACGTS